MLCSAPRCEALKCRPALPQLFSLLGQFCGKAAACSAKKRDLNLIPTSKFPHISPQNQGACQDVTPAAIICPALGCEILDIAWLFLANCREPEADLEIVLLIWSIRVESSCISAEEGFCCAFAGVFDCCRKR